MADVPLFHQGVTDGPACSGCGLPNYEGLCPVCRGDEDAARREGMPYPWDDEDDDCCHGIDDLCVANGCMRGIPGGERP